jgi:carboxylesterase type B
MRSHVFLGLAGSAIAQHYQNPITPGPSPALTVNTTSGQYVGFVDPSLPNVNQWHGLQYGTPPTLDLRFMPAVKAPYYPNGARSAMSYRNICYQNSDTSSGVFWTLVPEFQNTDPQSEDCLYLNIWAPRTPGLAAEKVPVLIWVVGGGFQEGAGHAPYQVPDQWIERTQSHIVVTFK